MTDEKIIATFRSNGVLSIPSRSISDPDGLCFMVAVGRDILRSEQHENMAMAQTNRERQEALRARRAMLGLTEVRGAYLPPELHARLKAEAKKMLKAWQREQEQVAQAMREVGKRIGH